MVGEIFRGTINGKIRLALAIGAGSVVLLGCAVQGTSIPSGSAVKTSGVYREYLGGASRSGSRVVCNRATGTAYSTGTDDFQRLVNYYKLTDRATGKVSYAAHDPGGGDVPCASPAACKVLAGKMAAQEAKAETNRLIRECAARERERGHSH